MRAHLTSLPGNHLREDQCSLCNDARGNVDQGGLISHRLHKIATDALGGKIGHNDRNATGLELRETDPSLANRHLFGGGGAGAIERVDHAAEPSLASGVSEFPVDCSENMPFHLHERVLLVYTTAVLLKISRIGDVILRIFKLGGDPDCNASNELIVLLIDDTAGRIAVENVDTEVESLLAEMENSVQFDHEVDEGRTHGHVNVGLLLHGGPGGHGGVLEKKAC